MDQKQQDEEKCPKPKSIIEFNTSVACSIKSLAVKKNGSIKPTTRFFSGKILTFAKVSLENLTYEFTDTFFFPNKKTREIYEKYMIKRILPYGVLMDTGSIAFFSFSVVNLKVACPIQNLEMLK